MQAEMIPGSLGFVTTVRLAWLNLARNRKRTAITAVTVTMAVFVLDISMSLLMGIERQSFDNLINYQTAHAKVFSEGYYEERQEMPLDYLLTELESIQAAVRGVSGVAATTPRISFSAQLSNGAEQIPSLGTGIQIVGSDSDVFRIHEGVVEGEYLRPGQDGILLGGGLAEVFEASVGDWLTVLTKTRAGAYEAIDLPIVGLLGTGNPLIDRGSFLIPLATAQRMLAMEGTATEVAIRFSSTANESRTLERVAEALGTSRAVEIKGWRDLEADFMALVTAKRAGQLVLLGILVILAVVGITNTMLMAAFERTREIGMMMALGLRGTGIRRLFLLEGALTGFLGGGVGTFLAFLLMAKLASSGIDFGAFFGDMDIGYPVKDVIYPAINVVFLAGAWAVTGALAALAALYPAARASRQDPVEALRHV